MALSPKIDQQMQQPSQDQEGQIFEQQFSEMAQSMLMSKLPQLAQDVATFKVIDANIDEGSAVGAFILQRPTGMLYIPVVLSENQIKPMEIVYSQEHDTFLPLNPEWLEEIERGAVDTMGEATKTPKSLYTDVDIRNLVVPPTTGRYSYASAPEIQKAEKWIEDKAEKGGKWVAGAAKKVQKKALKLPDFLRKAENSVKKKFAHVLEADRELLKTAVAIYGSDELFSALRQTTEKVAAETTATEELSVVNRESSAKSIKDIFGKEAPAAMRGIAVKGYHVRDNRKNLNRPVDEEGTVKMESITSTGAFTLIKKDGKAVQALVFHRPTALHNEDSWRVHGTPKTMKYDKFKGPAKSTDHQENLSPNSTFGVLLPDGAYYKLSCPVVGTPINLGDLEGKASSALDGDAKPKSGYGIFVRRRGNRIEGTTPVEIESVSTGSDGITRCKAKGGFWHELTIVMDPKSAVGRIMNGAGHMVSVPHDFKWVPVTNQEEAHGDSNPFVKDASKLTATYLHKLNGTSVSVKKASEDDYSIGGTGFSGTRIQTVLKLASDFRISVPHAEDVVKIADERRTARVAIVGEDALRKLAAEEGEKKKEHKKKTTVTEEPAQDPNGQPQGDPSQDPSMQGGDPAMQGDPSQDPSMQGMDPAMMGQPPMGAPSPTDQAVMELQEEVQRAHEEQMKLLQHKLDALQMVAQRTQEITQGVPKEQSVAIQQAVSTAAQGAPQAAAPAPQGQPGAVGGMDPGPAGQGQGAGMPQPGMPGQDPSMQGGQPGQPPMDPNAPVDPSMMQQASGMADPEMFDAAAIGSLAEHSSLKDLIGNYVPTLEKSVDHVGRILLSVWIKGSELRKEMGEENYTNIEDRLRNVFRGMGDVVLRLNKDSLIMGEQGDEYGSNDAA